jgi:hypothetical protein
VKRKTQNALPLARSAELSHEVTEAHVVYGYPNLIYATSYDDEALFLDTSHVKVR